MERHSVPLFFRTYLLMKEGTCPDARRLAEHLEVGQRTAERIFEYMRDRLGYDIVYDRDHRRYRFAGPAPEFPGLRFTQGEVVAVVLAHRVLRHFLGTPYEAMVRSVIEKISMLAPDDAAGTQFGARDLDDMLSFGIGPLRGGEERVAGLLSQLQAAQAEHRGVDVVYYSASRDEESLRRVDPYHLRFHHEAWYLVAYCHVRREIRVFAVDRIRELTLTDALFTVPDDFDIDGYLVAAWGMERGYEAHEVVVRFDAYQARWVAERVWHPTQRLERLADGALLCRFTVSSTGEIKRWILQFGGHAEVLEPAGLREEVKTEVAAMGGIYGDEAQSVTERSCSQGDPTEGT